MKIISWEVAPIAYTSYGPTSSSDPLTSLWATFHWLPLLVGSLKSQASNPIRTVARMLYSRSHQNPTQMSPPPRSLPWSSYPKQFPAHGQRHWSRTSPGEDALGLRRPCTQFVLCLIIFKSVTTFEQRLWVAFSFNIDSASFAASSSLTPDCIVPFGFSPWHFHYSKWSLLLIYLLTFPLQRCELQQSRNLASLAHHRVSGPWNRARRRVSLRSTWWINDQGRALKIQPGVQNTQRGVDGSWAFCHGFRLISPTPLILPRWDTD